ncbi:MAG: hypothetical protein WCA08_10215, partial [Desulfoferrobacter sp.]
KHSQEFDPRNLQHGLEYQEYDQDEISIKDLVLSVWRARARIIVLSLAALVLVCGAAAGVYLFQEKQNVAKLEFKLLFDGADKGQYPNGMAFSAADILSTPVLEKVYNENNLKRFMEFPEFKSSLSVYQTNPKLALLEYDYSQKLAEKNLSFEARQRLEAEYLEKRKNLMVPVFLLTFVQKERSAVLPEAVMAKVLDDILNGWADYAERVKGANEYQIELVSPNIISKDVLDTEDYLVATDRLRLTVNRVLEDIDKLSELPGAKIVQIGEKGISLSDLRYRMKDLDQFKLSPLFGLIRQAGVSRFPEFTMGYLQNRLFEIRLKMEQASADTSVYETSLNQYVRKSFGAGPASAGGGGASALQGSPQRGASENVPAMIPQFGSSFLDSLVQMAQENSDFTFRQDITKKMIESGLDKVNLEFEGKYYQDLLDKVSSLELKVSPDEADPTQKFIPLAKDRIIKTQEQVFESLMQTISEINSIYKELSKNNLNPELVLFTKTTPVMTSVEKPIMAKKLLIYVILALFFLEGVILVGVLMGGSLRKGETH